MDRCALLLTGCYQTIRSYQRTVIVNNDQFVKYEGGMNDNTVQLYISHSSDCFPSSHIGRNCKESIAEDKEWKG